MITRSPYLIIGRVYNHVEQGPSGPGTARLFIRGFDGNAYPFVGFYGDGIDLTTGNLHGRALIPREGQMVGILFEEGLPKAPVACFPLPYPTAKYTGSEKEKYAENALFDIAGSGSFGDIIYGHYKGQRILQRDDGSTEIQSKEVGGNRTVITLDTAGKVEITTLATGARITMKPDGEIEIVAPSGKDVTVSADTVYVASYKVSLASGGRYVVMADLPNLTIPTQSGIVVYSSGDVQTS